jgi:hypothetical protein
VKKRFNAEFAEDAEFTEEEKKRKPPALMTEAQNPTGEPGVDGATYLVEFAGKDMIDSFDDDEMIVAGERGDECFDFFDGAVLVVASVHEQLGLVALAQE